MRLTSPDASPDATARAQQRYDALVAVLDRAVIGLDFDGTLSPIVDDPERAQIHPDAPGVLLDLARVAGTVAVVTGRPASTVLELGGLEQVGAELADEGGRLLVFGQYGNERWRSDSRRVDSPPPPEGLADFVSELPEVLREAEASEAFVEEKGLAVAVHTRRLDDADAAFERLLPRLTELAERHGLGVEPGRNVVEVRATGMDKGVVVGDLVAELEPGGFLFAGDDLGDVEAFEALAGLREQGLPTLLVCAATEDESPLRDLADIVVPGPAGVLDLLRQLTADAGSN